MDQDPAKTALPFQYCALELVYHPLTASQAGYMTDKGRTRGLRRDHPLVRDIEGLRTILRDSDFYFICARPEMLLEPVNLGDLPAACADGSGRDGTGNFSHLPKPAAARRSIQNGREAAEVSREATSWHDYQIPMVIEDGTRRDDFVLDLVALGAGVSGVGDTITFEAAPEGVRVHDGDLAAVRAEKTDLTEWFTTDKLIFDRSRGKTGLSGLNLYRDFATYDLLYVGIAKSSTALDRVFTPGHHALQKILASEEVRREGARVSDEVCILGFRVTPWPRNDADPRWIEHHRRVKCDAEKAFIRALDPRYNEEKYAAYPRSKDGLWGQGYDSYRFVIAENMTFATESATLRGSLNHRMPQGAADFIEVTPESVELGTLT